MLSYTPYMLMPLLSGVVCAALAVYAGYYWRVPAARRLCLLMVAMSAWALVFALNLSFQNIGPKVLLTQIGTVCAQLVGLAVIALSLELTGHGAWMKPGRLAALLVMPAVVAALAFTSGRHELFMHGFSMAGDASASVLVWKNGPLFTVHYLYLLSFVAAATGLYLTGLVRASPHEKARYVFLVLVTVLPITVDLLSITPVKGLRMLHSTFWIVGIAYTIAISRYNLIDLVPVARRTLFEGMTDPVFILDDEGRLAGVNRSARETFGLPKNFIGLDVSQVLFGSERLSRAMADTGFRKADAQLAIEAAGRFWHMTVTGVTDRGTRREGRLVVLRDVSDLKAIEEQTRAAHEEAEKVSAAKSRFLGVLSHEMRTPLHAMIGSVELLEATGMDARQRMLVDLLGRANRALKSLIEDALDRGLIEAGRMTLARESVPLGPLLDDLRDLFVEQAQRKGLALRVEVPDTAPRAIVTDRRRLLQVLSNLVGNAVKFTDAGTVSVSASVTGDARPRLVITVRDTGVGIEPRLLPGIFEPFTDGGSAHRGGRGGVGLGLSIAREIVVLMGGEIKVESVPGAGSAFMVVLPLEECAVTAPQAPVEPPSAIPAGLRVLVVDDVPDNRMLARHLLEQVGAVVAEAADGPEALRAFGEGSFDCVLLDMRLPTMDGVAVARAMREAEHGRRTPIVAISADASEATRAAAMAAGCDTYLTRPVSRTGVFTAVGRTIQAAAPGAVARASAAPAIEALRSGAVARCAEYASGIAAAAGKGDLETARRLGHSVKGLGMTFGLPEAERVGAAVEEAAARGDAGVCISLSSEIPRP